MTDYFLHVDILVPTDKAAAFEDKMTTFLAKGAFRFLNKDFGNELALALKGASPFVFTPHDSYADCTDIELEEYLSTRNVYRHRRTATPVEVVRYVHLWTIPGLGDLDLASRMQFCSESKLYMEIDEKTLLEVQELVKRVHWPSAPDCVRPDPSATFVRTIRQLEYKTLGKYLLQVGALVPSLQRRGWTDLGQYQAVTGTLNAVIEFWQTEKTAAGNGNAVPKSHNLVVAQYDRDVTEAPASTLQQVFCWAPYHNAATT